MTRRCKHCNGAVVQRKPAKRASGRSYPTSYKHISQYAANECTGMPRLDFSKKLNIVTKEDTVLPTIPINELIGLQSMVLEAPDQVDYDKRHGINAKHYLTMTQPSDTDWIIARVKDRIEGRVVVEIGAGAGVLALELAKYAAHVYAIEADPVWSFAFTRHLYSVKPPNLTWILDRAENLVNVISGSVVIVSTGSDEVALRELAEQFGPEVIMPWQDWNGNKAIISGWDRFGTRPRACHCMYGCAMYTKGREESIKPGECCQLLLENKT